MESVRVDICYRPLRIGWAIHSGDMDAFRLALRLSFALWGGRFNPIIVVDQDKLALDLVDLFRLDMIVPVSDSSVARSFPERFPYLINPFLPKELFIGDEGGARSQVLDIHNALVHLQRKDDLDEIKKRGVRVYTWAPDDPLADIFLMQFGQYPSLSEIQVNYHELLKKGAAATEVKIDATTKLPSDILDYPSISFFSRYGLERRYGGLTGWDSPGFYSGDASNFDDLVCYWNLRAADIPLWFIDRAHLDRYGETIEYWDRAMQKLLAGRRFEFDRKVAVWVRRANVNQEKLNEAIVEILKPFGKKELFCPVGPDSLGGVRPPMMTFGEASTLGVMGMESGKPKVSFALDDKPFCGDVWFHTQHLVASLSFVGGLYRDEQYVLVPPYVPELNEFYARSQYFRYSELRSEPGRVGIVIDAADTSSFIYALPVADLFGKIFDLASFKSKLSAGGLITRQLISQLGGVDGARIFKIPGVRRLLKTYGPMDPFTKKGALQLIGSKDSENPSAKFSDYENLYIEPRPRGTKLRPEAVFTYLVEKGLFRMGAKLHCPHCQMPSWTALDVLKQRVVCDLCGHEFDATRQLVNGVWHYRRSGVLGAEKNAQGAVPVVLTLQQLQTNLHGLFDGPIYSPSLDLEPNAAALPEFEIDFAWLIPGRYAERTVIIIGECKDRGGNSKHGKDKGTIDVEDIDHLKRVADALPQERFQTFILLAKLCPFTEDEIALARTLNDEYRRRVILLTARELEPFHLYERTKLEFSTIKEYASTPEDLANNTAEMYFKGPVGTSNV